jgi:hypothetical protein
LASRNATLQDWDSNSLPSVTITDTTSTENLTVDGATVSDCFIIRCTATTSEGAHVFERMVAVRQLNLRTVIPAETQQYSVRGWADALDELIDWVAAGGSSLTPPTNPGEDYRVAYGFAGDLLYSGAVTIASGGVALEIDPGALGVSTTGALRVAENFTIKARYLNTAVDLDILTVVQTVPLTMRIGHVDTNDFAAISTYALTTHNWWIGNPSVVTFTVDSTGIAISPAGATVASLGSGAIRMGATWKMVGLSGANDADILALASGTLTIGETAHLGTIEMRTAGGGVNIYDASYTFPLALGPSAVFFPKDSANITIGHTQAASGGAGSFNITARAAASGSGANGALLALSGGAKDGAGTDGEVNTGVQVSPAGATVAASGTIRGPVNFEISGLAGVTTVDLIKLVSSKVVIGNPSTADTQILGAVGVEFFPSGSYQGKWTATGIEIAPAAASVAASGTIRLPANCEISALSGATTVDLIKMVSADVVVGNGATTGLQLYGVSDVRMYPTGSYQGRWTAAGIEIAPAAATVSSMGHLRLPANGSVWGRASSADQRIIALDGDAVRIDDFLHLIDGEVQTVGAVTASAAELPLTNDFVGVLEVSVHGEKAGAPATIYTYSTQIAVSAEAGVATIRDASVVPVIMDPSASGASVAIDANSNDIRARVTGVAAETWEWVASIEITQHER